MKNGFIRLGRQQQQRDAYIFNNHINYQSKFDYGKRDNVNCVISNNTLNSGQHSRTGCKVTRGILKGGGGGGNGG
jgi:hypothetical protein